MKAKKGDTCLVKADWLASADKAKRVRVDGLQNNASYGVFAKCRWLGPDSKELAEKYGTLFSLSELKVVNE